MSVKDPLELQLLEVRVLPQGTESSRERSQAEAKEPRIREQNSENVRESLDPAFPTGIISISFFFPLGEFDRFNYIELKTLESLNKQ